MTEILDVIGRALSILATALVFGIMIGVGVANELELRRERLARRRARAKYPIGDRFRQPPGGWNARR